MSDRRDDIDVLQIKGTNVSNLFCNGTVLHACAFLFRGRSCDIAGIQKAVVICSMPSGSMFDEYQLISPTNDHQNETPAILGGSVRIAYTYVII